MPPLIPAAIPASSLAGTAQPVLAAEGGLLLSPWEPGDALALLGLYADPAVQHWHGFRIDSDDEAREVIGRWQGGWVAEKSAHWKVTRGAAANWSAGSGCCPCRSATAAESACTPQCPLPAVRVPPR